MYSVLEEQPNSSTSNRYEDRSSKSSSSVTSSSLCLKTTLTISTAINIGFLATAIYFFLLEDNTNPIPPPPTPSYNKSCPYFNSTMYTGDFDTIEFSAYEIGSSHVKLCWPVYPHALRDSAPYEIEIDDWFTQRTEYRTAYSGASNEFTLTNLLPGQPLHIRLKVKPHLTTNAATRTSSAMQISTNNASYCGNIHDLTILRNASHNDMPDKLQNCAFDQPMVPCIEKSLGFSLGCSKCFAAENSCIVAECVMKNHHVCITDPKGMECKQCINQHCMAPTAECGGIALWALNITSAPLTPS